MTELPGFNVSLKRLADRRALAVGDLASLSAVGEDELRAVFDGASPSPALLRRLASAFHLHPEDLFVIAEVTLPLEMTPLDPRAGTWAATLACQAAKLPTPERAHLRRLAGALPQEPRTQPAPGPRPHLKYPPGPGRVLARLLANRNLDLASGARTFLALTGRYWSAATYGQVGRGRRVVTPELLADYATVLGVPVRDLAALTGVEPPHRTPAPSPVSIDVADLLWETRRLSSDQVKRLSDSARAARPS
ncbi:hypothetical protein [Streptacidiphilus monticola]|uniref:HTH cro/C1-type domain-containing protein n=1 Tax=Streptacidiphilus monticola TaxID=2161674 RepID=A0ABW1FZ50_9ACTN